MQRWVSVPFLVLLGTGLAASCGGQTDRSGSAGFAGSALAGRSGAGGSTSMAGGSSAGKGQDSDFDACSQNQDCTVEPRGCCRACGWEPAEFFIAINRERYLDYLNRYSCSSVDCGGCRPVDAPIDPLQHTSRYFTAICQNGSCQMRDVSGGPGNADWTATACCAWVSSAARAALAVISSR
jgi:hypothetical protein